MDENELYHHGILGMKWGVRRYQNKDGTLTAAGKKRMQNDDGTLTKDGKKHIQNTAGTYFRLSREASKNRRKVTTEFDNAINEAYKKYGIDIEQYDAYEAKTALGKAAKDSNFFDKKWNSFIDKYSDATLDDLGYKRSADAHDFVKSHFEDDLVYQYDWYSRNGKLLSSGENLDGASKKRYEDKGYKFKNRRELE